MDSSAVAGWEDSCSFDTGLDREAQCGFWTGQREDGICCNNAKSRCTTYLRDIDWSTFCVALDIGLVTAGCDPRSSRRATYVTGRCTGIHAGDAVGHGQKVAHCRTDWWDRRRWCRTQSGRLAA